MPAEGNVETETQLLSFEILCKMLRARQANTYSFILILMMTLYQEIQ